MKYTEYIRIYQNISKYFRICQNIRAYNRINQNLSKYIKHYQTVPNLTNHYLNTPYLNYYLNTPYQTLISLQNLSFCQILPNITILTLNLTKPCKKCNLTLQYLYNSNNHSILTYFGKVLEGFVTFCKGF